MTRISVSIAAVLAALAAGAQDIRFVPGQGTPEQLTDEQRAVAQLAIAALAEETGVAQDQILVDTVRAVQWRNSSLGCPKPEVAYLDVVTPGHKVTLRANGQIYVVHEAKNKAFVCNQSKALGGITAKRELTFGRQLQEARRDLAGRLGVAEADIQFLAGEGATWQDTALGCPEPDGHYVKTQVRGWKLSFGYQDRVYTYHTDMVRTFPCPAITAR